MFQQLSNMINKLNKIAKREINAEKLLLNNLLPAVYFSIVVGQVFLLFLSFSQGAFSEKEALRILIIFLSSITIGYFKNSQMQQKVIKEIVETNTSLSLENQAVSRSYDNLLDVVDKIDKQVLMKHGIAIQIEKKARSIN